MGGKELQEDRWAQQTGGALMWAWGLLISSDVHKQEV